MNFNSIKYGFLCSLAIGLSSAVAQEKDTEIKKEDVVVEFSFNPTLSDVFKLKSTPITAEEFTKEEVEYAIKSKEVPSDFVPVAKKASYVKVDTNKPTQYSSYVYGAAGMYGNMEFELDYNSKESRSGYQFSLEMNSINTQGGIDDERVDNGQWTANEKLHVTKQNRYSNWVINLSHEWNKVHWYGLDEDITAAVYENQDVKQQYNQIDFSWGFAFYDSWVKNITPAIQLFSDDFDSSEVDLELHTTLAKSLILDLIELDVDFQYLNGSFNQTYATEDKINYSFMNVGITPKYVYQGDSYQINAALGLFANLDQEASKSNFVFLPNVTIDVSLLENIMTMHGGIRSELDQNSYASLVAQNPWVSPTQIIKTTHTPVDVFLGLDGKLTKTLNYSVEGSYKQVKDMLLFANNNSVGLATQPYQLGNSFTAGYDDVDVISVKGNLESKFLEKLTGGVSLEFNSYSTNVAAEAWNLPSFILGTYTNYAHQKFNSQLGINFIGARKDVVGIETTDIDGFLDVNLKANYAITDQLYVHANLYNVLNNQYQTYLNYQVQGFQALGGLSYKF